jgi:hypothetical protein
MPNHDQTEEVGALSGNKVVVLRTSRNFLVKSIVTWKVLSEFSRFNSLQSAFELKFRHQSVLQHAADHSRGECIYQLVFGNRVLMSIPSSRLLKYSHVRSEADGNHNACGGKGH